MTFRAELDAYGREIYGIDSFVLYPGEKERAVFDPDANSSILAGIVLIPESFELASDMREVRRQLRLISNSTYTETHFREKPDGSWERDGSTSHHGMELGSSGLGITLPGIPGLEGGSSVTARIIYERDLPVISRIRRVADNVKRVLRLEQYYAS